MRRIDNLSKQLYQRRLVLKHFYEDADKKKHRTFLEIQLQGPSKSEEGWMSDGKIRISIGEDKEIKAAFILSIEEATRLIKALDLAVTDHENEMIDYYGGYKG